MFTTQNRILLASNIRYLGYICLVGCIITSCYIFNNRQKGILTVSALFIFNFSLLIWLGGRGALLAYIISTTILYFILRHKININKLYLLISLSVAACIISLPFNTLPWNGMNRLLEVNTYSDLDINKISSSRIEIWQESISLILRKPFFGYGPEAHIFNTKIGFLQPHNFILQFVLEFGFIGSSVVIFSLIYVFYTSFKNISQKYSLKNSCAFSILLALIIHAFYDGTLYHAPPTYVFCFLSAYVLATRFSLKRKSTISQSAIVITNET